MSGNVYVDPSELKSNSKFGECINVDDEPNFHPLPGLEEKTGADMMISPQGLPHPATDFLLNKHIKEGAALVQLKFGHDLVSSLITGRFKGAQERMIATGAKPDQIVLLFVGQVLEAKDSDDLMINGQVAGGINPTARNFKYSHYLQQRSMWAKRGGIFERITMRYTLKKWIECQQKIIDQCRYTPIRKVWRPSQKLYLVDDWRNMLLGLPGLGEKKVEAIYEKLEDKSWHGFMQAMTDNSLLDIEGIGKATIKNIDDYLKGK